MQNRAGLFGATLKMSGLVRVTYFKQVVSIVSLESCPPGLCALGPARKCARVAARDLHSSGCPSKLEHLSRSSTDPKISW